VSTPAPRLKVGDAGTPESIEPDHAGDLTAWREQFLKAFGTNDPAIADTLLTQLINVLHTDPAKPLAASTANLALALLHRLAPANELEAMLCLQLVVTSPAWMPAGALCTLNSPQPAGKPTSGSRGSLWRYSTTSW
jgi:hypothetical protein